MNYIINEQLVQKILNYLASRPYAEVYILVSQLQNLNVVKDDTKDEIKDVLAEEVK